MGGEGGISAAIRCGPLAAIRPNQALPDAAGSSQDPVYSAL